MKEASNFLELPAETIIPHRSQTFQYPLMKEYTLSTIFVILRYIPYNYAEGISEGLGPYSEPHPYTFQTRVHNKNLQKAVQ